MTKSNIFAAGFMQKLCTEKMTQAISACVFCFLEVVRGGETFGSTPAYLH